jgi:hypothetical protein
MERKKAEMLSTVKDSLAELEKIAIGKYVELLTRWHRRALARLGEVELLEKKLKALIITSQVLNAARRAAPHHRGRHRACSSREARAAHGIASAKAFGIR